MDRVKCGGGKGNVEMRTFILNDSDILTQEEQALISQTDRMAHMQILGIEERCDKREQQL